MLALSILAACGPDDRIRWLQAVEGGEVTTLAVEDERLYLEVGASIQVADLDGFYVGELPGGEFELCGGTASSAVCNLPISDDHLYTCVYLDPEEGDDHYELWSVRVVDGARRWAASAWDLGFEDYSWCWSTVAWDERLAVIGASGLRVLDLDDEELAWHDERASFPMLHSLDDLYTGYVLDEDGDDVYGVARLDFDDGELEWHAPVVAEGTRNLQVDALHVYVPTWDGVTALDKETGRIVWEHAVDFDDWVLYEADGDQELGLVHAESGLVFLLGENLWVLDAETGEELWTAKDTALGWVADTTDGDVTQPSGLAFGGDAVYVTASGWRSAVWAFEPSTGEVLWSDDRVTNPTLPTLQDDVLYVVDRGEESDRLVAFDTTPSE